MRNQISILISSILVLAQSGCHYRIQSSSWPNYRQFYPPVLHEQTYKVYQQPTPFDYVERLYLGEDSTFVQIVAGQLNFDPIKGSYRIRHGRLILHPDHSNRNHSTTVHFQKSPPLDSLMITAFSTWDFSIPPKWLSIKFPDTTVYESVIFADDTIRIKYPIGFDTITIYSSYLDNGHVDIPSSTLGDNNLISIRFGMSHPDSYRIKDNEKWRFSLTRKRLKPKCFAVFRKSHPYYYQGEIEINNSNRE